MHIIIKNKKLFFNHYKIKCVVGKRGISKKKIEGDFKTPKGSFKILNIFYRKDRVFNLKTNIPKSPIYKNMGWCDDPDSAKYNKLIKFPFSYRAEKLYRSDNIYDIILILNYNIKPTIKNKGSAIFIHVAKKKFSSTKGCVAVAKKELKILIKSITNKTKVKIF